MIEMRLLSSEVAFSFLDNPTFLKNSSITSEELTKLFSGYSFLGSYLEGSLIACTGIKQIGERIIEAHTFVLPERRREAPECLLQQESFVKSLGVIRVYTTATPLVKNFLIKRLGYSVVDNYLIKDL